MMIYLIKNNVGLHTIITTSSSELPVDDTCSIENGVFYFNNTEYANIITMPSGVTQGLMTQNENMLATVNMLYESNYQNIITENKKKFIIVKLAYNDNHEKQVTYSNFYNNIVNDYPERQSLTSYSGYYYDVYNYKTSKYERFIDDESALARLESLKNDFLVEYRSLIIKEFTDKNLFIEYLNENNLSDNIYTYYMHKYKIRRT
jgi:hypothetical protein